jgi:hypothetical protein
MSKCPNALLVRLAHLPVPPPVQQTPVPRREDTALSWSNTDKIEKFLEESKQTNRTSDVRWIGTGENQEFWKVSSTQNKVYVRDEQKKDMSSEDESESDEDDLEPVKFPASSQSKEGISGPLPGLKELVKPGSSQVSTLANPDRIPIVKEDKPEDSIKLPDVTKEVNDHLEKLKEPELLQKKRLVVTQPFSPTVRRNLHYDIMEGIKKQLAGVTIGQLLRDNPRYWKVVLDAMKTRRKKRLPATLSDMKFIEE